MEGGVGGGERWGRISVAASGVAADAAGRSPTHHVAVDTPQPRRRAGSVATALLVAAAVASAIIVV